MSVPIEAQSLSNLTSLFANPPQYPRNPTHHVHDPLTLYIVRVPGSKDIFLTPLKPPTKVSISLEAIQSALYYFHVNTEQDEELKQSIEQHRQSEDLSRPPVTVSRKPLAGGPNAPHPLPPLPEREPPPPYEPYQSSIANNTPRETHGNSLPPLRVDTDNDGRLKHTVPSHGITNPHGAAGQYPSAQSHQEHNIPSHSNPPYHPHGTHTPPSAEIARRVDHSFPPVTIIRRDPASGSQWNIGVLTLLEPNFSGSNIKPVCVELTTPGYGRFAKDFDSDTPRPGSARSDVASVRQAMQDAALSPASARSPDASVVPFTRLVDFRKMALSDLKRSVYQRTNSSDAIGKLETAKGGIEKSVLAFESPWHGTCTFVNAIDGKTLKIKHTISSNSSMGESLTANIAELRFNLGWSIISNVKDTRRRHKENEPDKLPIPKLLESKKDNFRKSFHHLKERSRESFQRMKSSDQDDILNDLSNIPTPTKNNLNDNVQSAHRPSGEYLRSYSPAHPTSSEDNEDEEARISLKLGRERAGGGFRGHSAKLGKIIIQDEGLKMCDLVVGAAMGVWWQHYGT